MAPCRTLVTGASGFLGSNLVRRLRELGERPRVFLRRPVAASAPAHGLDTVYGDLADPDAVDRVVAGVEIVYHAGAGMKGTAAECEAATVAGTRHIVDACLRRQVRRLVHVGSLGVLDHAGQSDGAPFTENAPLEPHPERRGVYTQTKMQAEQMVRDAMRDAGLPAVILRPGHIVGPGCELQTYSSISIAGRWFLPGRGDLALSAVYVEDLVDAMIAAATARDAIGEVIHLLDPSTLTQREFVEWSRRVRPAPVHSIPWPILWLAACLSECLRSITKRPFLLSRYYIRSLRPVFPADISKARRLLGWTPAIGLERGLERAFGLRPSAAQSRPDVRVA